MLIAGMLFYLLVFLTIAKIISAVKKKPINGAKGYMWSLALFASICIVLFIRGIYLDYWSPYEQGGIIVQMFYGFTVPLGVAYFLHKQFLRKHQPPKD